MSHHFTLIDTCVWLDLAIDPVAEPIVDKLEQLVSSDSFNLVVPKIIEVEFARHKSGCAEKLATRLTRRVQETLQYAKQHGDPSDNSVLLPALQKFQARIAEVATAAGKMVDRLEQLLLHSKNIRIETLGELLQKAALRGCEKRAPFIGNKNSVADALIVESFLDFHEKQKKSDSCTFSFVTVNKSDFCDGSDQRKPHPELGEPFASSIIRFSINIAEEINILAHSQIPSTDGSVQVLSSELVQHVDNWPGAGIELEVCPHCKSQTMEFIGGHPSQYGGWTVWQMCRKCKFKWDTGDFID